ncbi:neopullulanase [Vibrio variabilis]|uniref:Neopullulanase n=1 Tax=Vibrio variabilis TaxID=990271 RepID=A0ABQ0JJ69_9VIBR|nr:neopullulanase [Vibrio variabilis]
MQTHSAYPSHAKPNLMLGNHDLVRFGDLIQRGNLAEPPMMAIGSDTKQLSHF